LTTTDHIVDCTTGTFTVTLPAAGTAGREFVVKNSGTGTITLDADSTELIDNSETQALQQWDSLTVVDTGTGWIII